MDDHDHASETEDIQPFSEYDHIHLTLDRGSDAVTLRTSPLQELAGSIEVDRSRVIVGETVGVVWDVRGVDSRFLNHMDFLGLFEVTEKVPLLRLTILLTQSFVALTAARVGVSTG